MFADRCFEGYAGQRPVRLIKMKSVDTTDLLLNMKEAFEKMESSRLGHGARPRRKAGQIGSRTGSLAQGNAPRRKRGRMGIPFSACMGFLTKSGYMGMGS